MSYVGNTNTTQGFIPAIDYFSGNGSTVAFTLSRPVASVAQVQANISNVPQNPSSAFSVSGNTITFTSAPPSGTNNIYVYYTSPITQVIAPSQGTVGTTQLQNGLVVNFADGSAASPSITNDGDTNTGIFFPAADTIAFSEGGVESMRIDSSGNVGIGTSTPVTKLAVATANGNTGVSLIQTNGSTRNWLIGSQYNVNNGFEITPSTTVGGTTFTTPAVVVDSSGNLLVGDTSATSTAAKLLIKADTQTYNILVVVDTSTTYSASNRYATFYNSSNAVAGAIQHTAVTTVNYSTSSDSRLKIDKGISTDTSVIDNTIVHDFEWKADGSIDKGVFAQEAFQVKPKAVCEGEDTLTEDGSLAVPWSVDYSKYVPDLIVHAQQLKKQIQEQQAIITSLTDRITALEGAK